MKSLMKHPVLAIGILFMTIFLLDLNRRGYFQKRKDILKATSCRASLVKLNRRVPNNWLAWCDGNNMLVRVDYSIPANVLEKIEANRDKKKETIRPLLFRELANTLIHIAKNSPEDNLERTNGVNVLLRAEDVEIEAITKGENLVKLATLSNQSLVSKHIQNTVKVKEVFK